MLPDATPDASPPTEQPYLGNASIPSTCNHSLPVRSLLSSCSPGFPGIILHSSVSVTPSTLHDILQPGSPAPVPFRVWKTLLSVSKNSVSHGRSLIAELSTFSQFLPAEQLLMVSFSTLPMLPPAVPSPSMAHTTSTVPMMGTLVSFSVSVLPVI